jgi:hypothetical protein
MTKQQCQFSLRSLFIFTTSAAVIAFLARNPRLALLCLLIALPVLLVRATFLLAIYYPRVASKIFALFGMMLLVATSSIGAAALQDN